MAERMVLRISRKASHASTSNQSGKTKITFAGLAALFIEEALASEIILSFLPSSSLSQPCPNLVSEVVSGIVSLFFVSA